MYCTEASMILVTCITGITYSTHVLLCTFHEYPPELPQLPLNSSSLTHVSIYLFDSQSIFINISLNYTEITPNSKPNPASHRIPYHLTPSQSPDTTQYTRQPNLFPPKSAPCVWSWPVDPERGYWRNQPPTMGQRFRSTDVDKV